MKEREIKYELLRIVCMMMVTSLHFWGHSSFLSADFSGLYITGWAIETISLVATDVFIIISSFFLYNSSFSLERIIKLYAKVFFVSIICMLISFLCSRELSFRSLVNSIFPLITRQWGFFNNYFLFYLCVPIIKPFVNSCDRKRHKIVVIFSLSLFSLLPTIFWGTDFWGISHGDSFVWFIIIYLIVSYIRKYDINIPTTKALLIWIIPVGIQYISRLVIASFTTYKFGEIQNAGVLYHGDITIFTFISALGLFFLFKGSTNKLENSPKIRFLVLKLSSASFVVYLFQEHPMIRDIFWNYVFSFNLNNYLAVIIMWLFVVITVYLFATLLNIIISGVLDFFFNKVIKAIRG